MLGQLELLRQRLQAVLNPGVVPPGLTPRRVVLLDQEATESGEPALEQSWLRLLRLCAECAGPVRER